MTKKLERIWVSEQFKRKIKSEASQRGLSILEFTDNIAKTNTSIEDFLLPKKKNKRGIFDNVF